MVDFRFPELFDFMSQNSNEDTYYEDDIFDERWVF